MNKTLTILLACILPVTAHSADVLKANSLFKEKLYPQAFQEYQKAAKLGNDLAYYQLGAMYNLGLGTEKDVLNALIHFSLAADNKYRDAEQKVMTMLSQLPAQSQQEILTALDKIKIQYDPQRISDKYFPVINQANLTEKVTFDGEPSLEYKFYPEDFGTLEIGLGITREYHASGESENLDGMDYMTTTARAPFIIIDNEVAADGSIRYTANVQKNKSDVIQKYISDYTLFPGPKPQFKGKPVDFINRAYIGSAAYNQFSLIQDDEGLYSAVRREAKTLQNGTSLNDRYQYAMTLLNFSWLPQETGEVDERLLTLAKEGHPAAMYEYGLKLYREQRDIPEAVHWITQASIFGLAKAEYRLAKLLQSSPWVMKDEKKALFWYESAMEKNHLAATLRAIEIKLTAQDNQLKDVDGAIKLLTKIEDSENNNPEYYYLLALSHKDRENRDFTQVVSNLQRAISSAETKNWDVSEWQGLLAQMTTGKVYIIE